MDVFAHRWWFEYRYKGLGPTDPATGQTGDIVTVAAPELGRLVNRIRPTDACERWTFGAGALMRNLAKRGLL